MKSGAVQAEDMPVDCLFKLRKAPSPPLSGLRLPNMVRYVFTGCAVLLRCEGKLTTKREQNR